MCQKIHDSNESHSELSRVLSPDQNESRFESRVDNYDNQLKGFFVLYTFPWGIAFCNESCFEPMYKFVQ